MHCSETVLRIVSSLLLYTVLTEHVLSQKTSSSRDNIITVLSHATHKLCFVLLTVGQCCQCCFTTLTVLPDLSLLYNRNEKFKFIYLKIYFIVTQNCVQKTSTTHWLSEHITFKISTYKKCICYH
jgi:hypothetical protein